MADQVYCKNCFYRVAPNLPEPYESSIAANPEVVNQWAEWEKLLGDVERAERERFRLKLPFNFKPRFYSWCQWWTDSGLDQCVKDQFGEPIIVYELTARRNAHHDCEHFLAAAPDSE
jgi:hypothetical protein